MTVSASTCVYGPDGKGVWLASSTQHHQGDGPTSSLERVCGGNLLGELSMQEVGYTSSPLIIKKITMGLRLMHHEGRVRTRSISDMVFVIFVNIFGEVK